MTDRNIWCRYYGRCLDRAIESGVDGFSCRGCQHQGDQGGKPQEDTDRRVDAVACRALLLAAYRGMSRLEAIDAAYYLDDKHVTRAPALSAMTG